MAEGVDDESLAEAWTTAWVRSAWGDGRANPICIHKCRKIILIKHGGAATSAG
ncbi:hypothetical protein [Paenibacillus sp. ACRRX]|uniref:hypothetical protein n=1 Tax=Paenibacillus sp. ACRRX TaxID=2918206 RepID=UPI001EF52991|nr:hypothetical protein [Paenibacillus sp. ACRRX]MDK8181416.1 hypothetical protein [Paenibacillus sp. UMB4589-SE434]